VEEEDRYTTGHLEENYGGGREVDHRALGEGREVDHWALGGEREVDHRALGGGLWRRKRGRSLGT
jgi:hypothetical protein